MITHTTIAGSPAMAVADTVPFRSAEEAWFWFIQAQTARNEGARIEAGTGLYPRPCEPVDIIAVLERLYRNRKVTMHHVKVMRHYGLRMMRPRPSFPTEAKSSGLWDEAMEHLENMLVVKQIVVRPHWSTLVPPYDA